jgi:hypothetical protein
MEPIMPLTLRVSKAEAEFLSENHAEGIDGFTFTLEPSKAGDVLTALPKDSPSFPLFAGRIAQLAGQFGFQDALFAKAQVPAEAPPAPTVTGKPWEPEQLPTADKPGKS